MNFIAISPTPSRRRLRWLRRSWQVSTPRFTSSSATGRSYSRPLRSMHGRLTIAASPICTASLAKITARRRRFSIRQSLSIRPSREATPACPSRTIENAFMLKTREREQEITSALEHGRTGTGGGPQRPRSALGDGSSAVAPAGPRECNYRTRPGDASKPELCLRLITRLRWYIARSATPCAPSKPRTPQPFSARSHPMLFAIFGARTFALLRLGKMEEAAIFAIRGAEQPRTLTSTRARSRS